MNIFITGASRGIGLATAKRLLAKGHSVGLFDIDTVDLEQAIDDKTFKKANLQPDIVMSALDSDVIKTYAELGLGIGILASMAYNADKDTSFTLLDSKHLFAENTTHIAVRQGHYLRGYAYQFIELCNQNLTEAVVRSSTRI